MKNIFKIMAFMLLAISTTAFAARANYNFTVFNEIGRPVTDTLSVTVTVAGSAETVYAAKTGSTTGTTSGVTTGNFEFWSDEAALDLEVSDGTTTVFYDDFTVTDHQIILPAQKLGDTVFQGSLSLYDDETITFGNGSDAAIAYDETTDDRFEITATTTAIVGVAAITGNATVGGTLGVTGNATLGGTCGITGNTTVGGTLGVTGVTTFTTHVALGDDDEIRLGAAPDATIKYDETTDDQLEITCTGGIALEGVILYKKTVATETDETTAVTAAQTGTVFIASYTGTKVFTLPAAATGLVYTFIDPSATAANDVRITATGGAAINGGTADKSYECTDDAVGSVVTIVSDGTNWYVIAEKGT